MWTRIGIKTEAKDFLRKHYFKAFIVCLILILVSSSGEGLDIILRQIWKME